MWEGGGQGEKSWNFSSIGGMKQNELGHNLLNNILKWMAIKK